jgi:hypothetical protein
MQAPIEFSTLERLAFASERVADSVSFLSTWEEHPMLKKVSQNRVISSLHILSFS